LNLLNILNKNSDLQSVADRLAKKAKAEGTLNNYNCLKRKFECFCAENSYDFHNFSEQAVLHFVLKLEADNVPYKLLGQVKPALMLMERLAGRKESVFSQLVDTYFEAAKRRAAEASEKSAGGAAGHTAAVDVYFRRAASAGRYKAGFGRCQNVATHDTGTVYVMQIQLFQSVASLQCGG
jgi:hypothetical protein